jgi:glycosyltransferase involved in cell wall biosynthesis
MIKKPTSRTPEPFVSIVTPVYNGERYLRQCIESVLAQTHRNFEYIVVDNCSTDATFAVALSYANRDARMRVLRSESFLGVIQNHNRAVGLISPRSAYCKVVSADDWLYPECVTKLVELAERHPTVGVVGSYAIYAEGIRWLGLPPDTTVFSGRQVCRQYLLGAVGAFATPSTVLYRARLVRSPRPFFPGSAPNGDLAACLRCLQTTDFAFVHQILSFERVHQEQVSSSLREVNGFLLDRLEFVDEYGPIYLEKDELTSRRQELLDEYFAYLAIAACTLRSTEFWNYHKARTHELGYRLIGIRLARAVFVKILDLVFNPAHAIDKIRRRLKSWRSGRLPSHI